LLKKMFSKFLFFIGLVFSSMVVFAQDSKPWDFLRPVSDFAMSIDNVSKALVLFFSLLMFAIAALAYFKVKSKKLLIVAAAFGLFALKYLLVVFDIFLSPGNFFSDAAQNVVELIVFILLFWAIFKKQ